MLFAKAPIFLTAFSFASTFQASPSNCETPTGSGFRRPSTGETRLASCYPNKSFNLARLPANYPGTQRPTIAAPYWRLSGLFRF